MTSDSDQELIARNLYNDAMRFLAEGRREVALKYLDQASKFGHTEALTTMLSVIGAGLRQQQSQATGDGDELPRSG